MCALPYSGLHSHSVQEQDNLPLSSFDAGTIRPTSLYGDCCIYDPFLAHDSLYNTDNTQFALRNTIVVCLIKDILAEVKSDQQ